MESTQLMSIIPEKMRKRKKNYINECTSCTANVLQCVYSQTYFILFWGKMIKIVIYLSPFPQMWKCRKIPASVLVFCLPFVPAGGEGGIKGKLLPLRLARTATLILPFPMANNNYPTHCQITEESGLWWVCSHPESKGICQVLDNMLFLKYFYCFLFLWYQTDQNFQMPCSTH